MVTMNSPGATLKPSAYLPLPRGSGDVSSPMGKYKETVTPEGMIEISPAPAIGADDSGNQKVDDAPTRGRGRDRERSGSSKPTEYLPLAMNKGRSRSQPAKKRYDEEENEEGDLKGFHDAEAIPVEEETRGRRSGRSRRDRAMAYPTEFLPLKPEGRSKSQPPKKRLGDDDDDVEELKKSKKKSSKSDSGKKKKKKSKNAEMESTVAPTAIIEGAQAGILHVVEQEPAKQSVLPSTVAAEAKKEVSRTNQTAAYVVPSSPTKASWIKPPEDLQPPVSPTATKTVTKPVNEAPSGDEEVAINEYVEGEDQLPRDAPGPGRKMRPMTMRGMSFDEDDKPKETESPKRKGGKKKADSSKSPTKSKKKSEPKEAGPVGEVARLLPEAPVSPKKKPMEAAAKALSPRGDTKAFVTTDKVLSVNAPASPTKMTPGAIETPVSPKLVEALASPKLGETLVSPKSGEKYLSPKSVKAGLSSTFQETVGSQPETPSSPLKVPEALSVKKIVNEPKAESLELKHVVASKKPVEWEKPIWAKERPLKPASKVQDSSVLTTESADVQRPPLVEGFGEAEEGPRPDYSMRPQAVRGMSFEDDTPEAVEEAPKRRGGKKAEIAPPPTTEEPILAPAEEVTRSDHAQRPATVRGHSFEENPVGAGQVERRAGKRVDPLTETKPEAVLEPEPVASEELDASERAKVEARSEPDQSLEVPRGAENQFDVLRRKGVIPAQKQPIEWEKPIWAKERPLKPTQNSSGDKSDEAEIEPSSSSVDVGIVAEEDVQEPSRPDYATRPLVIRGNSFDDDPPAEVEPSPKRKGAKRKTVANQTPEVPFEASPPEEVIKEAPRVITETRPSTLRGESFEDEPQEVDTSPRRAGKRSVELRDPATTPGVPRDAAVEDEGSDQPTWAKSRLLKATGIAQGMKSEGNLTVGDTKSDWSKPTWANQSMLKSADKQEKQIEWEKPIWAKERPLKPVQVPEPAAGEATSEE